VVGTLMLAAKERQTSSGFSVRSSHGKSERLRCGKLAGRSDRRAAAGPEVHP